MTAKKEGRQGTRRRNDKEEGQGEICWTKEGLRKEYGDGRPQGRGVNEGGKSKGQDKGREGVIRDRSSCRKRR